MEKQKVIFQGAEAEIILSGDFIIKHRLSKEYRIPEIDEKIRKRRTKAEEKLLEKASKIIDCPKPIDEKEKFSIKMPFIKGKKLSDNLSFLNEKEQLGIFKKVGTNIAKIHDINIIHGDLTTSNMILNDKDRKIYFIDFGLGFVSHKIEDKAVDLHLLKHALNAKHPKYSEELFSKTLEGYKVSKNYKKVMERLKAVEKRGRYKDSY